MLIDGLKYKDIHLREELRMGRLLSVSPWTHEELNLSDFGRFPWEEETEVYKEKTLEELRLEDEEIFKMIQNG